MTTKYKRLYHLFALLSFLATVGPLGYFLGFAVVSGEVGTAKKVTLTFTVIACAFLVLVNAIKKYRLRSPFFIILIGLQACLNNLEALFIALAVATIADEFILSPLKRKYRAKYRINREIDDREQTAI